MFATEVVFLELALLGKSMIQKIQIHSFLAWPKQVGNFSSCAVAKGSYSSFPTDVSFAANSKGPPQIQVLSVGDLSIGSQFC